MERIKKVLRKELTTSRYEHVLRVAILAKALAKKNGISEANAECAALLHDIAKCKDKETLYRLLKEANGDERLFQFHHELWHGPVGAMIAEKQFGITNEDILHAVRFHTTGRANMSTLEKIIFVADLLEPGRSFSGIEQLREQANNSLDEAMKDCIVHSIGYLVSKRVAVFPDSFDCYNEYMLKQFHE